MAGIELHRSVWGACMSTRTVCTTVTSVCRLITRICCAIGPKTRIANEEMGYWAKRHLSALL